MAGFLCNTAVLGALVVCMVTTIAAAQGRQTPDSAAVQAISPALCRHMKAHHVLKAGAPVGCGRLRLVRFGYIDFDGNAHEDGEIVVMDAIAHHVLQIFKTLESRRFPIARARLMNDYDGNDDASMDQNNTSAFNHRNIAGGNSLSLHAYGVAIDLNPVQNPYVLHTAGKLAVSPRSGAKYLDRKNQRPGMSEAVLDVFAENGLSRWGGFWRNPTDYQHFEISYGLTSRLIHASPAAAAELYEQHVQRYLACVQTKNGPNRASIRRLCAAVD
jgi:hypothetical protein